MLREKKVQNKCEFQRLKSGSSVIILNILLGKKELHLVLSYVQVRHTFPPADTAVHVSVSTDCADFSQCNKTLTGYFISIMCFSFCSPLFLQVLQE